MAHWIHKFLRGFDQDDPHSNSILESNLDLDSNLVLESNLDEILLT